MSGIAFGVALRFFMSPALADGRAIKDCCLWKASSSLLSALACAKDTTANCAISTADNARRAMNLIFWKVLL
jgi:hypothetical protein